MDAGTLAYMANQIARNFAVQGEAAAVAQTAEHIRLYWEPRMIADLRAAGGADLQPIAAAALERV